MYYFKDARGFISPYWPITVAKCNCCVEMWGGAGLSSEYTVCSFVCNCLKSYLIEKRSTKGKSYFSPHKSEIELHLAVSVGLLQLAFCCKRHLLN